MGSPVDKYSEEKIDRLILGTGNDHVAVKTHSGEKKGDKKTAVQAMSLCATVNPSMYH